MSVKIKQAITKCLQKIEDSSFDEDTIRTMLILSREHIRSEGLIRELAHFIAHNERSQGMFHRKVNSRYTKFKIVRDQVQGIDLKGLANAKKTENELSDFMLGGISIEKIEAKLFNILFIDGLDDLPEHHVQKYTGLTRNEVKELLNTYFVKKNGFYYLKTNTTENLVRAFKSLPIHLYNPAKEVEIAQQILQGEQLAKKIKARIDGVLKVVRGAIFFDSVFEPNKFRNEIYAAIEQVLAKFDIDKMYLRQVQEKSDEILLCIMTLLHDSKFTFYDKNEARTFLCLYLGNNYEMAQSANYDIGEDMYSNGVLALYLEGEHTITFPLFVSDLPVKKYLSYDVYNKHQINSSISKSIWTTATRAGNTILQLTCE